MLTLLTAIMLAMSAGIVTADGSDPLDPSDGGADWDGDGLTNSEEQNHGTNMNNADSDGDGLPDGWEIDNGLDPLDNGVDNFKTADPTAIVFFHDMEFLNAILNLLCPQTGQLQVTDASLDSADTNTDQASHPTYLDLSGSSSTAPADPPRPGTAMAPRQYIEDPEIQRSKKLKFQSLITKLLI